MHAHSLWAVGKTHAQVSIAIFADCAWAVAEMHGQDVIVMRADCAWAVASPQARNRKDDAHQQVAKASNKMVKHAGNSHDR